MQKGEYKQKKITVNDTPPLPQQVAMYVAKEGITVKDSNKRGSGGEYTQPPLRKKRKSVSSRKRRSRGERVKALTQEWILELLGAEEIGGLPPAGLRSRPRGASPDQGPTTE